MKRNSRNTRGKRNRRIEKQKDKNFDKKTISSLLILIFALIVMFIIVVVFNHFYDSSQNTFDASTNENTDNTIIAEEVPSPEPEKTDTTFSICAIGDVMCHNTQYFDAYQKETDTYDFRYVFDEISYYTKIADITVGSLETSFAGKERGYSNYPTFNSPDDLAYALKDIGVDVLSTAGNHCLDMGFSGLSRTIDVLNDADIAHLGTYKTQEEQDKILFKYVKGVKLAFINYTYGTNGIPVPNGKEFCVNLIDKDLITKHIQTAKSQNADVIIACMHWGSEYRTTANNEQIELADFLFQNGVDIILGNHPHVLEQMEKRTVVLEDGSTKDGFVIYALGNFICDQRYENTRNSIILNLTVTKHSDGSVSVDHAKYTPIYMYNDTKKSIRKMKVLDINNTLLAYESGMDTSIGETNYNFLNVQLDKIKKIVGEEF